MKPTSNTFPAISGKTGKTRNTAAAGSPDAVIPAEVKRILTEVGQVLNAAIITTDAKEVLGEPWLGQLKEIHGNINASLKGMSDTERVPAAQEAFYTLGYLKNQFLYLQNCIQNLIGSVKSKSAEYATAMATMTDRINEAISAKIKAGDLVEKATVENLVQQARNEGITAGLNQGKLRSDRLLSCNKLPAEVVAVIPDALLLGEEAAFAAARDAAGKRIEKLTGVGIVFASATKQVTGLPWASQEDFDSQIATFEGIHAKAKGTGTSLNAAPAPKHPAPSGLAGGSGAQAAIEAAKPAQAATPILC